MHKLACTRRNKRFFILFQREKFVEWSFSLVDYLFEIYFCVLAAADGFLATRFIQFQRTKKRLFTNTHQGNC